MGFWERTSNTECTRKQNVSWFFPLTQWGHVNSHQQTCQQWPGRACEQKPGAQTPKDAWSWTMTRDQLSHPMLIFLGRRRGSWSNTKLSWERVTGWFFSGCLRGNGRWGRNLTLFLKTLVITVSTVNRFLFLCYFLFLNLCSSCNDKYLNSYQILLLPRYYKIFLSFPMNSVFGDLPGRRWVVGHSTPNWLGSITYSLVRKSYGTEVQSIITTLHL